MKPGLEVLIVEDHQMIREYIADELRAKGHIVQEAETVLEAEAAIDTDADVAERDQSPRRIGAIVLDGRFPYGDDRDEQPERSPIGPAASVVRHALERGLADVAFIGFSSSIMTNEGLGIDTQAGIFYTDVGKHSGGPREILKVLDGIS